MKISIMPSKVVGIVGGMGPEAGVDLAYKIIRLSPARRDQEHIHVILDNFSQIPDRTAYILGRGENPLPYLIQSVERLKNAGAEIFVMSCNTAHYFYDDIVEKTGVHMLHIARQSFKAIENMNISGPIGVLGTVGTLKGKIYEGFGYEVVYPDDKHLAMLMDAIYGIKAGEYEGPAKLIDRVIDHLVGKGAVALIMACTEIPLVKKRLQSPVPIVDATLELARAVVKEVYGIDAGR